MNWCSPTMNLYPKFSFHQTYKSPSSKARIGQLVTPHGNVDTPAFIFCGTKATVKGVFPSQLRAAGTQIILSNTYHLMLQPGSHTVKQNGGLQKWTGWNGPMFTDSGGFQIFSLGHGSVAAEVKGQRNTQRPKTLLKIHEDGATFKSYLDGKVHKLTPESSIQVQKDLGADLIVVLDECTPFHVDKTYTASSLHRTHRWGKRSLQAFQDTSDESQALYGIIQGGIYEDLRKIGADFVNDQPFFAHAVGGSLGKNKSQMQDVVSYTMSLLDPSRPVHLLGIGGVEDIFHGVRQGIDTFDCVHPTRIARHGCALVNSDYLQYDSSHRKDHINLRNARFVHDTHPIDDQCPCETCHTLTRGYIHHLLKAHELLAMNALTLHNITFMNRLLNDVRDGIRSETLNTVEQRWVISRA